MDHFHLVQLANRPLTEVRRRVTVTHRGQRGRKGNREWELRNRLTRSAALTRTGYAKRTKVGCAASTSTLSSTSCPTCPG